MEPTIGFDPFALIQDANEVSPRHHPNQLAQLARISCPNEFPEPAVRTSPGMRRPSPMRQLAPQSDAGPCLLQQA